VVLRRILGLFHCQREQPVKIFALYLGWLLKGGRIRAAHKVSHVCTNGSAMARSCRGSHLLSRGSINGCVLPRHRAIERARFLADFAVTAKGS
jgi:hypothetical protein